MTLNNLLTEAKLRVVLKTDKKFPPRVLAKIESTGLKGEELYNLKKTIMMQQDSGIAEKDLLKLIDDYMRLVYGVHKAGKQLV